MCCVKPRAARTLRDLADRPKPSSRSGVPPALRFRVRWASSPSILFWWPSDGNGFHPRYDLLHCCPRRPDPVCLWSELERFEWTACSWTTPVVLFQLPQPASSCHQFRGDDGLMIKQVIMPILVMEEPGMTRRDNRPYFQKNSTDDCLTTVKLAAKLRNTER